jgi:tRNA(adenine34) deaminase
MYVTLEPCMMCCGALANARIKEVVFAAKDPKSGAVVSNDNLLDSTYLNHRVKYREGPFSEDSSTLLKDFFAGKRN